MRRYRNWLPAAVLLGATLVLPTAAQADFLCPACTTEAATLGTAQVVELVLTTVLQKGVGVLLLAATAIVSLPWLVAGAAIFVFYIPRWIKA